MLEVRLLGTFELKYGKKAVNIASRPAQSLFAYLILSAGTSHRREKLAGMLWPDSLEETARDNLRHALWRVRKALESASSIHFLHADDLTIKFEASSEYWLDADALEKLSDSSSADELMTVLSEYQGELLPGFYDEWVMLEREHLNSIFEQHMSRLMFLLQEEKHWSEILDWGERWIKLGQKPEPAYRALMTAHAAKGDMSKVAATYERCVKSLKELGVEPSAQTRALYEKLKAGKETLEPASTSYVVEKQERPQKTNLPVPITSFIGREKEIEEVIKLVGRNRLVTLTGAGGAGKTRLAIQSSNKLLSKFKDGVFWVELAPLAEEALVPQVVAQVLGAHQSSNQPLVELLKSFLRQKQLLLVMDNCEHLIAGCAYLADILLGACPNLKILATSREALGLISEEVWPVPILSLPNPQRISLSDLLMQYEGIRLFVERASAARSDFTLTDGNALSVVQVCQRLDGMPLAIELAAARARMMSVSEIAKHLDERFDLLTAGSRTALPRHQTLRAAIDWSYDLLSEPERLLFNRLSVFAGGFTLNAAEEVAAGGDTSKSQVIELLGQLINKSLVTVQARSEEDASETRYGMLETIREYAREKLEEAGEMERLRQRHCNFFVALAEKAEPYLFGAGQQDWKNRLELDHDNLRVALAWSLESNQIEAGLKMAGALAWFWQRKGHLSEGNRWLEKILASSIGTQGKERAKALRASSFLSTYMGDYIRAGAFAESSIKLYREIGDNRGAGLALADLGASFHFGGRREEAIESLEESLRLLRATGEQWGIAYAHVWLGDTWFRMGDLARASTNWEESLRLTQELGDHYLMAWSLAGLADVARRRADYKRATGMFKEALSLYLSSGDKIGAPFTLEALGLVAAALGDAKRMARLWGAASAWREAINEPLPLSYQRDYAPSIEQARAQLGEKGYTSAWSEGHAMTLEQAIELALQ